MNINLAVLLVSMCIPPLLWAMSGAVLIRQRTRLRRELHDALNSLPDDVRVLFHRLASLAAEAASRRRSLALKGIGLNLDKTGRECWSNEVAKRLASLALPFWNVECRDWHARAVLVAEGARLAYAIHHADPGASRKIDRIVEDMCRDILPDGCGWRYLIVRHGESYNPWVHLPVSLEKNMIQGLIGPGDDSLPQDHRVVKVYGVYLQGGDASRALTFHAPVELMRDEL